MSAKTILSVIREYKRGHFVAAHSHEWPQLLYASSGVMTVETTAGSWIVPANRAVWLPAGCIHETRMLTDVQFNSLYMNASVDWRRIDCKVIEISPLLRQLILVAKSVEGSTKLSRRDNLAMQLIFEELRSAKDATSPVPMPQDTRLQRLCRMVIQDPSLRTTFDRFAAEAGGSTKTFARLFDRELGVSFREWRELVQLGHATAHLVQGVSIKATASLLGYTPSAFSAMLRRVTGETPQALQRRLVRESGGEISVPQPAAAKRASPEGTSGSRRLSRKLN